jgi:hypothetical protein
MITVVLPLSARVIMALLLVSFCLICFKVCNCLLCVMLGWLLLCICFSFLVAMPETCYSSRKKYIFSTLLHPLVSFNTSINDARSRTLKIFLHCLLPVRSDFINVGFLSLYTVFRKSCLPFYFRLSAVTIYQLVWFVLRTWHYITLQTYENIWKSINFYALLYCIVLYFIVSYRIVLKVLSTSEEQACIIRESKKTASVDSCTFCRE